MNYGTVGLPVAYMQYRISYAVCSSTAFVSITKGLGGCSGLFSLKKILIRLVDSTKIMKQDQGRIQGGCWGHAPLPTDKCTKLLCCKGDIQYRTYKGQSEGVMTLFFAYHLTLGRKIGHLQSADVLTFFFCSSLDFGRKTNDFKLHSPPF